MANQVTVTKDLENKKLIVEREFEGPQDKVWSAYADKDMFEKWWGPEGWETTTKEFNFTAGGNVHYGMKCVDKNQGDWYGQTSWGVMAIQEVDAPNSFTYIDYFSDEEANLDEKMPALRVTNQFIDLGSGRSKLVSTSYADTADQIEQLLQMGMIEGFTSQLNKLDEILAEQ
jgi:uncharacterized protein YndB with AHSA1/START domain